MLNYVKNKGIQNEHEFIEYFNHRKVKELNPMANDFIISLFPNAKEEDVIYAIPRLDKGKTDFIIIINEIDKKISVKMGYSNSVHLEKIESFVNFLRNIGIEEQTIKLFLKFHYADGTLNGNGKIRLSSENYKQLYQNEIDKINLSFNKEDTIKKAIEHFVIRGRYNDNIDVLVHGTVNNFFWIHKEEIFKIMLEKKDKYSTGIHFGLLYCQPWTRNLQYKQADEYKREYIQIKWHNLLDDIIEVMAFYRKKNNDSSLKSQD